MKRFDEHGNDMDKVYSTAGRGATFAEIMARRSIASSPSWPKVQNRL